ncbi:hypothetical protein BGZ98_007621 [Dissophora globulifera]|nr:hypothetical protein BGZ98_007621 [Dissophora globulifera]
MSHEPAALISNNATQSSNLSIPGPWRALLQIAAIRLCNTRRGAHGQDNRSCIIWMPFLNRVLNAASRRRPPTRRQGSLITSHPATASAGTTAQQTIRHPTRSVPAVRLSKRSSCGHGSVCHARHHGSTPQARHPRSFYTTPPYSQQAGPATFSDLYPVFRFILESRRHGSNCSRQQCQQYSAITAPSIIHQSSRSSGARKFVNDQAWIGDWQSFSRQQACRTPSSQPLTLSAASPSAQRDLLQTTFRTLYSSTSHSTPKSAATSRLSKLAFIPTRSISQQHSTRAVEDIPDLRIPEEFLPIDPTERVPPQTPAIFKKWVKSQILHARDLFQKQNYMQALVVIDKARSHDYMRELSLNPALSTHVIRLHLQDLSLTEFCCRLVSAHENQMGNVDTIETLNFLNTTVLSSMGASQKGAWLDYKTTFRRRQDPLVDYTLAIITRGWNQTSPRESGLESLSLLPQDVSAEQAAFASAALPFLKATMDRQLFPSDTSVLLDLTSVVDSSGSSLRGAALEMCLTAGDPASAMHWMWLWNRYDHKDWQMHWGQSDSRQSLVAYFLRSDQPYWIMDLARLGDKSINSSHSWIQDLVASQTLASSPMSAAENRTLERILHFANVDVGAFAKKESYYHLQSWSRADQIHSWLSDLQDVHIPFRQEDVYTAEQHLWREMAMTGVLSRIMTLEDVTRSVSPELFSLISPAPGPSHQPLISGIPVAASRSDLYHDTLTDYLENSTLMGLNATKPYAAASHSLPKGTSFEAAGLLKRAIQEVMARYSAGQASAPQHLQAYRDLLHNVAHHIAIRSRHLGLVSQVTETRFRARYGDDLWHQTHTNTHSATLNSQQPGSRMWKDSWITTLPQVSDFVNVHLKCTVALMCASTIEVAGSPMEKWQGRLSDWFVTLAGTTPPTRHMVKSLQFQARLLPGTQAYSSTMMALIESQELDVATALHTQAYGLLDFQPGLSPSVTVKGTSGPQQPTCRELTLLIRSLARSESDPKHLEQAQWVFDQHLEKEVGLLQLGSTLDSHGCIDIRIVTELAGAWFRRAEFVKARRIVEIMWERGFSPNMVMYNTLLKALVDLTPHSKSGGRTMGSGKQSGMRELGREMMVQQLLRSRAVGTTVDADSNEPTAKRVRSELDEGWELFQSIISRASEFTARGICLPGTSGQLSPSIIKSLISPISGALSGQDDSAEKHDGRFQPDSYTFAILLGAFARRGEIESISELFVEMTQLKLEPDIVICGILANAFAKKGDLKAVHRVIQEARIRNLDPGLYVANTILDSLVEKGAASTEIREALDGMIANATDSETSEDLDDEIEIPVRRLDNAHSSQRRLHQDSRSVRKRTRMLLANLSLDPSSAATINMERGLDAVTLTTLIKYHTRQNDLDSAQDLLQLMLQAGLIPDSRAYVLLLATCIRKRDIVSGVSILQAMRAHSNELPDAKAWKGLLRCAMELEQQRPSSIVSARRRRDQQHRLTQRVPSGPLSERQQQPFQLEHKTGQVALVLNELSIVLGELERAQTAATVGALGDTAHKMSLLVGSPSSTRDYLSKILTTSWLSLPSSRQGQDPGTTAADNHGHDTHSGIKGKNGLLRRVLNHLLRSSSMYGSSSPAVQTGGVTEGDARQQQAEQTGAAESEAEIEQRCDQAVWLVQLVEAAGLELGPRWKRDVVVRKIQALTGRDPAAIMKQLARRTGPMDASHSLSWRPMGKRGGGHV